jgi:hypothetical protein
MNHQYDITLPYVKNEYPEFEIEGEEWDEKLIFKTPKYWLQIRYELNYTITLELIDKEIDKEIIYIPSIPNKLADGLKEIGQNRIPTCGIQLLSDPFAQRNYSDSDSGYSDDDRSQFSDTLY